MQVSAPASGRRQSGRIARALYRLPIVLYRRWLGRLVSEWRAGQGLKTGLLVLHTRGRVTGLPRQTALEYREAGGRFFFVAGWGSRSDWVLNIERDPEVSVEVGGRVVPGQARAITLEPDFEAAFEACRKAQPRPVRAFYKLFGFRIGDSEAEQRRMLRATTVVVMDPVP